MPLLAPLTSLSQLQQLEVKGMVPTASEVFLPASVTKLVIEWGWWCEQLENGLNADPQAEHAAVQDWLACGPLPSLQELHFTGVVGEELPCNLDFSGLLGLRELHFMVSSDCIWDEFCMPISISQLSDLEVLQLGIAGQPMAPWHGPVWQEPVFCVSTAVLGNCTSLRSLGYAYIPVDVPVEVHFPHLSSLQLDVWDSLPEMVNPSCCPSLQHLVVQCSVGFCPSTSLVQRLAQLTALTCLQLNSGGVYYGNYFERTSWCGLEPLGRSLLMLRRLELISCYGVKQRDGFVPLVPTCPPSPS
jgi:hypothetical protein